MENLENLNKFAINMTQKFKDKENDPVIGRDREILSVVRTLSRKSKNNPILIGNPGVGKTAIVEGLVQRILANDVPANLKGKEVYSLDLGLLIAGAKFQGEFEERLKGVIDEVIANNDKVLLFIDEIHTLIGAGKTSGALDAANLLKPALSRGEINCIGATTISEYRMYIEKDSAFERRFQKVNVNETSVPDTLNILRGLKDSLEAYHGVKIEDEALIYSAKLADRYVNDRYLPDKAIDIIDEACALVNVQLNSQPEEIDNLKREIAQLEINKKSLDKKKNKDEIKKIDEQLKEINAKYETLSTEWNHEKAIIRQIKDKRTKLNNLKRDLDMANNTYDYELAAKISHSDLPQVEQEIKELESSVTNNKFLDEVVSVDNIYEIIGRITGVEVSKLQESNKEKILNLNKELAVNIKGQTEAIDAVYKAVLRSKGKLNDYRRPIASFLFVGPTGVGKTEVAKTLADVLFDNRDQILRIDMSEYSESHSVARLIGAPPGYVGYEEGGQLTEYVRVNPYSLILFDEIEKAHPQVLNVLLQLLEEGELTDSKGTKVNFKNCIIISTSNIGSQEILRDPRLPMSELTHLLLQYIKPEILNRIDKVVKFEALTTEVYREVIVKFMEELKERLNEEEIKLNYDEALIDYILTNSYQEEFGARVAKRLIQDEVESILALNIIEHDPKELTVSYNNETVEVTINN